MSHEVFIIHGWTYSLDKWDPLVDSLKRRDITVHMLKVPGLTSPSSKVWDIDGYVIWLEKALAGQKRIVLVGHSNGGRIAMSYIQKHPKQLSQLILIDSAGVASSDTTSRLKQKVIKRGSKIAKIVIKNEAIKKLLYRAIGAHDYVEAPPNMKQTMQNMLLADSKIDASAIHVPTTIIWGRDDAVTPLTDGELLHSKIVGSKLRIIENARHSPFFTFPDQVADIIAKIVTNKT